MTLKKKNTTKTTECFQKLMITYTPFEQQILCINLIAPGFDRVNVIKKISNRFLIHLEFLKLPKY